jgi:hypothetical protein
MDYSGYSEDFPSEEESGRKEPIAQNWLMGEAIV